MQIAKWGNSLAVRLPAALVRKLNLGAGDEIELVPVTDTETGITLTVRPKPSRKEIVDGLRSFSGRLPRDFVFDRDEAQRRG